MLSQIKKVLSSPTEADWDEELKYRAFQMEYEDQRKKLDLEDNKESKEFLYRKPLKLIGGALIGGLICSSGVSAKPYVCDESGFYNSPNNINEWFCYLKQFIPDLDFEIFKKEYESGKVGESYKNQVDSINNSEMYYNKNESSVLDNNKKSYSSGSSKTKIPTVPDNKYVDIFKSVLSLLQGLNISFDEFDVFEKINRGESKDEILYSYNFDNKLKKITETESSNVVDYRSKSSLHRDNLKNIKTEYETLIGEDWINVLSDGTIAIIGSKINDTTVRLEEGKIYDAELQKMLDSGEYNAEYKNGFISKIYKNEREYTARKGGNVNGPYEEKSKYIPHEFIFDNLGNLIVENVYSIYNEFNVVSNIGYRTVVTKPYDRLHIRYN
jgi:hypothetical protein